MSTRPIALVHRSSEVEAGRCVGALFDEHARMVLGLCRLLLRDSLEAEDAAQETFLSAYRSLLRGTEPRQPAQWLAAIARNECRDRIKRRMLAPATVAEEESEASARDAAEVVTEREAFGQLTRAIADLPARQRQAIVLRHFYGLSYDEVAAALHVPVTTVEGLVFRSRRRLSDAVRGLPAVTRPLVVPAGLREELARLLPGFAGGAPAVTAGGAGLAGLVAKLSMPVAANVTAGVAVMAGGTAATGGAAEVVDPRPPPAVVTSLSNAVRPSSDLDRRVVAVREHGEEVASPVAQRSRGSADDEHTSGSSGPGPGGENEEKESVSSGSASGDDDDGEGERSGPSGSGSSGDEEEAERAGSSGSGSGGSGTTGSGSGDDDVEEDRSGSSGSGSGGSDSSGPGSGGSDSSGSGSGGSVSSGPGPADDDHVEEDRSGSSGPGSGGQEVEEQSGSSGGSGSGESGSSGSGSGVDLEEDRSGSSGPGSAGEDDEDEEEDED